MKLVVLLTIQTDCAYSGITLSPKQAERANMITKEAKLENVQFQVPQLMDDSRL